MIDKSSGSAGEFTTVIGADAAFKGELSFDKGVRVDGKVEGKISTKGHLAISQGGKLQADVNAGSVVVEGQVQGNLNAGDRIELRKSARLQGDITAGKLLVAEGATFVGHCKVGPEANNAGGSGSGSSSNQSSQPSGSNRINQKEAAPRK